jgi:hypothetical protein
VHCNQVSSIFRLGYRGRSCLCGGRTTNEMNVDFDSKPPRRAVTLYTYRKLGYAGPGRWEFYIRY